MQLWGKSLISLDGDQGFPGNLTATCTYAFGDHNNLKFEVSAITDKPTPVNLSQHSYFNLEGTNSLTAHTLRVDADKFTPVNRHKIPSGAIENVARTAFDFRSPRILDNSLELDHNFVLAASAGGQTLRDAAQLRALRSGLTLDVLTTLPGLQVYNGYLLDVPILGLGRRSYGPRAGICLETQHFPNSPNLPQFQNPILSPSERYFHQTEYRFSLT